MMDMIQRGELINALQSRGFKPVQSKNYGWEFEHEDGFTVDFDANGKFELTLPNGQYRRGVMEQPSDVLSVVDKASAEL